MASKKIIVDLDLDDNQIKNLSIPTDQNDGVNKDFIDGLNLDIYNTFYSTFETATVSPPSNFSFRLNNTNPLLATEMYIDIIDTYNFDISSKLSNLSVNHEIFIQEVINSELWVKYKVVSIVDNTTYYTINIELLIQSVDGLPNDTQLCRFKIQDNQLYGITNTTGILGIGFDGGGGIIGVGLDYPEIIAPYDCIITAWSFVGDVVSDIEIDVWISSSGIPTITDSITAVSIPELISERYKISTNLAGWTLTINEGDIIKFDVVSNTAFNRGTFNLLVTKTGAFTPIPTIPSEGTLGIVFDGFGGTILANQQYPYLFVPFNCTINNWSIVADTTGNIEIDIWRLNNAIPTVTDSIVNTNYITLTAEQLNTGLPTGWTSVNLLAGDIINFDVRSATTITKTTLILKITK